MEQIIYEYLSLTYEIGSTTENSKSITLLQYDAIFKRSGSIGKEMVYGDKLLKELVLLFYIDEVTLKKYVNSWARGLKKKLDLEWFWKQEPIKLSEDAISALCNTLSQELMNVNQEEARARFTASLHKLTRHINYDIADMSMDDNITVNIKPVQTIEYIETKITLNKDLDLSD